MATFAEEAERAEGFRDLYDVLAVAPSADFATLQRAYRRRALELHPDKRHGRGGTEEEWTQRFQELQRAWEVLKDETERRWYDEHREHLLRTEAGEGVEEWGAVESVQRCMRREFFAAHDDAEGGGGDGGRAFFERTVRVFREIYAREERFGANGGPGSGAAQAASADEGPPPFGDGETPYDPQVAAFYVYWENFVSSLAFSEADEYFHPRAEAPNRRVRRAMEKENRKLRERKKREYQDAVRELVRIIKGRDPRVKRERKRREKEEARVLQERKQREAQRKAERKAEMERKRRLWEEQVANEEDEHDGAFRLVDEEEEDDEYEYESEEGGHGEDEGVIGGVGGGQDAAAVAGEAVGATAGVDATPSDARPAELSEPVPEPEPEPQPEPEPGPEPASWSCEPCGREFATEQQHNQHVNSKPHRKKLKELQKRKGKST